MASEFEITIDRLPEDFCERFQAESMAIKRMRTRFLEVTPQRIQRVREIWEGENYKIEYSRKVYNIDTRGNEENTILISSEELHNIQENYSLFGELIVSRYTLNGHDMEINLDIFENVFIDNEGNSTKSENRIGLYAKMELEGSREHIQSLTVDDAVMLTARLINFDLSPQEHNQYFREISETTIYDFLEIIGGEDLEENLGHQRNIEF